MTLHSANPHPAALSARAAEGAFAHACLDPEAPVPANLAAPNPARALRRFSIYRNNAVVSLMEALAATFPATEQVVGEEFFREAARIYVRAHPPRSPLLTRFGAAFPHFLEGFAPAAALPYLPDLARLELAVQSATHAADAQALSPDALAQCAPQEAMDLRLAAHPAARVVRSAHPVVTIWRMNRGLAPLGEITPWAGEDALVTRPALQTRVLALPEGGAAFLRGLGARLGDAVAAALRVPGADLPLILGAVVSAGAITLSPSHREDQP